MITGNINFFGIACIYTKTQSSMRVTPINKEDKKELFKYRVKKDYLLSYESISKPESCVLVKDAIHMIDGSLKLNIKYTAYLIKNKDFDGCMVSGDEIDVFFSPINYYFNKHKDPQFRSKSLLYDKEIIDTFKFTYSGVDITIDLVFGEILSKGIASDLKLHPKLYVKFSKSKDISFVYDVVKIIKRFLQFVSYKTDLNLHPTEVHKNVEGNIQNYGCLIEGDYIEKYYSKHSEVEYSHFKPYINNIFQMISDDKNLSLIHFPINQGDVFKYDMLRYLSCYSAFEYECKMKDSEYLKGDTTLIKEAKENIIRVLKNIDKSGMNSIEKEFIEQSKSKISQLGTQLGQVRKITNAYDRMKSAFQKSEFLLPKDKEIKIIARELTNLRGRIVHENYYADLSEEEISNIKFLDVLSYSMMLRRCGIDDEGIEIIIGTIFYCNFIYLDIEDEN